MVELEAIKIMVEVLKTQELLKNIKHLFGKVSESALAVSNPSTHVFYYCDQVYIGLIQDIYRSLGVSNKECACG